jgi:hypothetical protein
MKDWLETHKKDAAALLAIALSGFLTTFLGAKVSLQGDVTLSKETILKLSGWVVSSVVVLAAYVYQLRKRDSKRERIKFAKEMGRRICPCTEEGEIMLLKDSGIPANEYECPRCKAFFIDMKDLKVKP